ncbi:PilZ domain-containing protein [Bradyrhizobium sp. AUGA SZCCT0182]|uniref:PilZ domain-containing protein n=1 Tax=Bradyrhizobium sp. AUGA SZCCT0182 TaxID=2807667 RepID=UPI0028979B82|nr:PilZ domain-containing protein [Bradyrhizobium sp. AUGA SZCCT0182]
MIDERRKSLRTDVDEMAYISASGSSTRCQIANMSEDGAALDVPTPCLSRIASN